MEDAPPAQAHGQRTNSFSDGYFAVIKNAAAMEPDYSGYRRTHDIVDVPLKKALPEGWEFCSREEAHAYIFKIEGGAITSTMFRLL